MHARSVTFIGNGAATASQKLSDRRAAESGRQDGITNRAVNLPPGWVAECEYQTLI